MAIVVADASVLVAFLDGDHPRHAAAHEALDLAEDAQLVLPATAYAKVLVGAFRTSRSAVATVQECVEALQIVVARLGDTVVLAAADVLRADEVLTARKTFARLHPCARTV